MEHTLPSRTWDLIQRQSPWRQMSIADFKRTLPEKERWLTGHLTRLLQMSSTKRHQVILGPRRTGKTTILNQTAARLIESGVSPQMIYGMSLDHPGYSPEDLEPIVLALLASSEASDDNPLYLFIDEIVRSPQWGLWLKIFHDQKLPVRIAATSSAVENLRAERRESGPGRWDEHYLMPMQFLEYAQLKGWEHERLSEDRETLADRLRTLPSSFRPTRQMIDQIFAYGLLGGFPETMSADIIESSDSHQVLIETQNILYGNVVERVAYKVIPQITAVRETGTLETLLYALAGLIGETFEASNLSQDLGVSRQTINAYTDYLSNAYLLFTLPRYSKSSTGSRGRKLYFVEGAIANGLRGGGEIYKTDPVRWGHILENMAASTLRTLSLHEGKQRSLCYWKDKYEVDLIYNDSDTPVAFEISNYAAHNTRGLRSLIDRHAEFHGRSYLVTPEAPVTPAEYTANGIGTLPLYAFLACVAEHTVAARIRRANAQMQLNLASP